MYTYRTLPCVVIEKSDPKEKRCGFTLNELRAALETRFDFADETTRDFGVRLFWRCVLPKVKEPEGNMPVRWMAPGSRHFGAMAYQCQYIWDTAFMLDALSWLPGMQQTCREIMSHFWRYQDWWDSQAPEYAKGMIGHGFAPGHKTWNDLPRHSCTPLLAWGVERIYQHNRDIRIVKEAGLHLEQYHEWFWRDRDPDHLNLIAPGCYGEGKIQGAKDEQGYDCACDMDELRLEPHPARPKEPAFYGNIYSITLTANLLHAERCLERLARLVKDGDMAKRRRKRIKACETAIRKYMWNEERSTFTAFFRKSYKKINTVTIGSWVAMQSEAPSRTQARRMLEELGTPEWMTPLPVPTVGRTDPKWESGVMGFLPEAPNHLDHIGRVYNFWRGDVWPPTNYQVAAGCKAYGADELAARISDATIMNAILWGDVNERYCCDTGVPTGNFDYGMSAAIMGMLTDGLTSKYRLKVISPHISRANCRR